MKIRREIEKECKYSCSRLELMQKVISESVPATCYRVRHSTEYHEDLYLDTKDLRLATRGASLRMRWHRDRNRIRVNFKKPGYSDNGVLIREEVRCSLKPWRLDVGDVYLADYPPLLEAAMFVEADEGGCLSADGGESVFRQAVVLRKRRHGYAIVSRRWQPQYVEGVSGPPLAYVMWDAMAVFRCTRDRAIRGTMSEMEVEIQDDSSSELLSPQLSEFMCAVRDRCRSYGLATRDGTKYQCALECLR